MKDSLIWPNVPINCWSAAHIAELSAKGVVHVRNALPQSCVERISEVLNELDCSPVRDDLPGGALGSRALTTLDPSIASLSVADGLVRLAMDALGSSIRLVSSQHLRRMPIRSTGAKPYRTPDAHGWHRDVYGLDRDCNGQPPRCAIKVFIVLSSARTVEDGHTRFSIGSHLLSGLPVIETGSMDPAGWVDFKVAPGDLIVFENRTAHAGGICTGDQPFEVLSFQYGYRWLRAIPARVHPATILEEFSPAQKQVLEPSDLVDGLFDPKAGERQLLQWYRGQD